MRAAALAFELDQHLHEHVDVELEQQLNLDQLQLIDQLRKQLELQQRDGHCNRAVEFLELLLHQVLTRAAVSAIRS